MNVTKTIYKRDTLGKIRYWFAEIDEQNARYRSVAGIEGEQTSEVASGWTTCVGKQGRNDAQQAHFEAYAEMNKKLDREYSKAIEAVDERKSAWVKPMLAHKYEGWKGACYSQPKLDGIRCIATGSGLFSREGRPILGVPHIREALAGFFSRFPEMVLDGELYNHELHDDFNAIVSVVKKQAPLAKDLAIAKQLVQYHVYDTPMDAPFGQRSQWLVARLPVLDEIELVTTEFHETEGDLDRAYNTYLGSNYEGQMVRLDGTYEHKRSKLLLKRKEFLDAEFPVVAVEEGNGNWAGYAKRMVLRLADGRQFGAGIRGTQAQMRALLAGPAPLTATVRYFALTPDGIPRFPVVTAFHDGPRL